MDDLDRDREHGRKLMQAIQTVWKAFPDVACVRCDSEAFNARLTRDPNLVPGFRSDEVVELICRRCGHREQHVLAAIEDSLEAGALPIGVSADGC